jgi:sialic acid synthase SpsE
MKNKVTVIAELCQNHKGDFNLVEEMVHAASEAGANIVKIQSIDSGDLTHRKKFDKGLIEDDEIKVIKRPYKEEYERLKLLDLNKNHHLSFIEVCKKYNITPMTTIFNLSKINYVAEANFQAIKLASYDCGSHFLIKELLKKKFDKIVVSSGASYDDEIEKTCHLMRNHQDFSLLHCVTIYPTPLNEAHLNRIKYLKTLTKNVGISDHSDPEKTGYKLCVGAVDLGASIIEKHFTILEKDQTRDGPVSVNEKQLKELITLVNLSDEDRKNYIKEHIPEYEQMLGKQKRDLSKIEILNRDYYRGRFASNNFKGEVIYNWEETDLNELI